MTARENAVLGYRCLALWFVVTGVYDAAARLPFFRAWSAWDRVAYNFGPPPILLVASYLLWRFAGRLARATFPQDGEATSFREVDAERLLAVAFSTLGAWCVVQGVPGLISGIVALRWYSPVPAPSLGSEPFSADPKATVWRSNTMAWTVAAGVRLAIGLLLLAGPNRLARAVRRIRLELSGTLHDDTSSTPPAKEPSGGAPNSQPIHRHNHE